MRLWNLPPILPVTGWPDALTCISMAPNNCFLYVNPRDESRRWDKFAVVPVSKRKIAMVKDINGDGKPALIYGGDGYVRYAKREPQNPTGPGSCIMFPTG